MDPDTLLNCGRASKRLFDLVCDRIVWRNLLKKIGEFSKEKLEELVVFGKKGSAEMMPEVVKEEARRIPFCPPLQNTPWEVLGDPLLQEYLSACRKRVKITLAVPEGWGTGETFEVGAQGLEKLNTVAQAVGAKFTIEEVDDFRPLRNKEILKMIAAHMDQQGGKLGKLAISVVDLMGLSTEDAELFFALLKMSNSWSINLLLLENHTPHDYWTSLASISAANGHINQLILPITDFGDGELNLNALRKVWEISDQMKIRSGTGHDIGGGRACNLDNLEAEWQRVVDILQ